MCCLYEKNSYEGTTYSCTLYLVPTRCTSFFCTGNYSLNPDSWEGARLVMNSSKHSAAVNPDLYAVLGLTTSCLIHPEACQHKM